MNEEGLLRYLQMTSVSKFLKRSSAVDIIKIAWVYLTLQLVRLLNIYKTVKHESTLQRGHIGRVSY